MKEIERQISWTTHPQLGDGQGSPSSSADGGIFRLPSARRPRCTEVSRELDAAGREQLPRLSRWPWR